MQSAQDVEAFLHAAHPDLADLALWVRELLLTTEPDLVERVYPGWDGIGFRHPDGGYVCAIYPRENEQAVRLLFEHGARLEDPDGLLEGDGTQTRFIRIRERDDRLAAAIRTWIAAAVVERLFRC
jgi:hypothetical protein